MSDVIGIGLGTTNCWVGVMAGERPKFFEDSEGDRHTPSIVAFS